MYSEKQLVDASKFLSFVLRHRPEAIGLALDAEGWADVGQLLAAARRDGRGIDRPLLDAVVANNDKRRFSFSEDGKHIRAAQGHSTGSVAINYEAKTPPALLYHGTATRFLASIREQGLVAGSRHFVHLSAERETAVSVGARHGRPVVLLVDAAAMHAQGLVFHQADNGVWLTKHVAVTCLRFPDID